MGTARASAFRRPELYQVDVGADAGPQCTFQFKSSRRGRQGVWRELLRYRLLTDPEQKTPSAKGLPSDRLFADWELSSARVEELSSGSEPAPPPGSVGAIEIPADWAGLIKRDANLAKQELLRVRREFEQAFSAGLVCAGFERSPAQPRYLLYKEAV